jgi:hypothetical protein
MAAALSLGRGGEKRGATADAELWESIGLKAETIPGRVRVSGPALAAFADMARVGTLTTLMKTAGIHAVTFQVPESGRSVVLRQDEHGTAVISFTKTGTVHDIPFNGLSPDKAVLSYLERLWLQRGMRDFIKSGGERVPDSRPVLTDWNLQAARVAGKPNFAAADTATLWVRNRDVYTGN